MLEPLLIEGGEPGGQLMGTTEVDNFPGFSDGIMGPELMASMRKQAERFGTKFATGRVTRVDFSSTPFKLFTEDETFETESLIIATGASARWLNLPNEQRLRGKGVSACATCDGFFFKGKDIAVVGGGDSAMEEAMFLTRFANSVTVIVRGDELRASKAMQERAKKDSKIKWLWSSEVVDVLGEQSVAGLKIKNAKTGELSELSVTGLFLAIGHTPNTDIFKGALKVSEIGYLEIKPGTTETSVAGVFAAGDVADRKYRQAITAAGTGCMAALEAERYLAARE